MIRFLVLVLVLALVAGLSFAQEQKQPAPTGEAPKSAQPKPLKSAPLPKDLADELKILDLAAQHVRSQYDVSMQPINAKFESVRLKACEAAKIPDCGISQDPQGSLIVQEKPKPPQPEK
jgi:hypothetical protein